MEVERMSYNQFTEKYGGGYEAYRIHAAAFLMQCNPGLLEKFGHVIEGSVYDTAQGQLRLEFSHEL